ncbi:MAG: flagellar basal-body MS-ring/collar protein FliF [Myxococcaceae bacterium]
MEPLFNQLKELPKRFTAMPRGTRILILGVLGAAIALSLAIGALTKGGADYQYAFTNLSQEDGAEAQTVLKASGVPFRVEAGGSAISVPADKVYDVRLLLASAGLPKTGGAGFELFDRGDLGVSEFTQKVNLRRAIEGELARTIGKLTGVRSARVTVSLGEKGLYRDEDKKPSATVVTVLQPGITLQERELGGIRHLVASAVPGLEPSGVTIIDGRGAVLAGDSQWENSELGTQRKLERDLEQRVVTLLEPVVGAGAVVARITATMDNAQVQTTSEVVDPDGTALKGERSMSSNQSNQTNQPSGVAGAQSNQPLQPMAQAPAATTSGSSNTTDNTRNYEVSKTTTTSVNKNPRLQKLSVAIVVDGLNGKPRDTAEMERLGALARKAVGFDENRGDQFEISSAAFGKVADVVDFKATGEVPWWRVYIPHGLALIALMMVLGAIFLMRKKPASQQLLLRPGATVAQLESGSAPSGEVVTVSTAAAAAAAAGQPLSTRDRARALAGGDPARTAMLVRAWLNADNAAPTAPTGATNGRS